MENKSQVFRVIQEVFYYMMYLYIYVIVCDINITGI